MSTKLFIAIVLIPSLLSFIYYQFFASDIYISEAKYSLRVSAEPPSFGLIDSFMGSASGLESSNEDANIVMNFILSRDMIIKLDKHLALREHYESEDIDLLSRFNPNKSQEDFLMYYRDMVIIDTDTTSKVSTLRVRAFDPLVAQNVAQTIIELSEDLVNNLSNRIVEDSLQFARNEVVNAEAKVHLANNAMTKFRNESSSFDPGKETSGVMNIILGLERQLADARTQLFEGQSYMQDESTQIQVLKGKVLALEQQVREERKRLNSKNESDRDYTRLIDNYQPLLLDQELATKQYASALTSLELARIDAQRKQRYLLPFISPQAPDEAMEPNRLKLIITIFLTLCIIYAIGALIWSAIKDHMRL
jgi:capsular polysaccharide transport system permease protein